MHRLFHRELSESQEALIVEDCLADINATRPIEREVADMVVVVMAEQPDHKEHHGKEDASSSERRNSASSQRRPSFLSQVRNMIHPRSNTLGASMFRRPSAETTRRVQVAECSVETVYDLRDQQANFYDDDQGFRRPRSNSSDLLLLRKTSRPISFNVVGVINEKSDPYHQYMSLVDVYELCPNSSKIVIIDSTMPATRAFRIMRDHNITTLIVWDTSAVHQVKRHILTLTDCLHAIRNETHPKGTGDSKKELTAADILPGNSLVSVSVSSKILELCEELYQNRLHRVVVLDDNREVVHIISIRRVIAAIHKQNRSLSFAQWLSRPIGFSTIGTWDHVAVISKGETVYRALEDMLRFQYSALPIVDEKQEVLGVITKTDICKAIPLSFFEPKRWLQETLISDILPICKSGIFIKSSDSIGQVLDLLINAEAQTAFAIHNNKVCGAISLTDFLAAILRNPLAVPEEEPATPMPPTPESCSSSQE